MRKSKRDIFKIYTYRLKFKGVEMIPINICYVAIATAVTAVVKSCKK
jgi:hypothetical protein